MRPLVFSVPEWIETVLGNSVLAYFLWLVLTKHGDKLDDIHKALGRIASSLDRLNAERER